MGTRLSVKSFKKGGEWHCLGFNGIVAWKKFVDEFAEKHPEVGCWGDYSRDFEYDWYDFTVKCLKEYIAELRKNPDKVFQGDVSNEYLADTLDEIIEHVDVEYLLINRRKYEALAKDSYEYEKIQRLKDKYECVKLVSRPLVMEHTTGLLPGLDGNTGDGSMGLTPCYHAVYMIDKTNTAQFSWS